MRNTPPANGAPWEISPPTSGGKYRARVWPNVQYAWKPCRLVVLSLPVAPSSLALVAVAGVRPIVRYAGKPCRLVVLSLPVAPSSLELFHEIGNVRVVLSSVLKSYELCVNFQK